MSKNLNVNTGNYTIRVAEGNTITLDTGATGTTTLTGNLTVQGTTTTVNSSDLSLKDNIIVLNDGETGSGVTLNTSGIRIDRGSQNDATLLFDNITLHLKRSLKDVFKRVLKQIIVKTRTTKMKAFFIW